MIIISTLIISSILFSQPKVDSNVIDLIMLGEYEMLSENYETAKVHFENALNLDSTSATIFLNLSEINLIENNIVQYAENINKAFLLDTTNIEIGLIGANAYLISKQFEQSEYILLILYKQFPTDQNIQATLLEFYKLTKQWLKVIEFYIDRFSNNLNQEEFFINAIDIALATDNGSMIIEKVKTLLLLYPENEILLSSYLKIVYKNQLYSHAKTTLLENIKKNKNPEKLEIQLAEIYILLNDFSSSKEILEKIIPNKKIDEYLYNLISITYTNSADFEKLLFYSEKYIQSFPEKIYGYENKIISLLQLQKNIELINFSDSAKIKFPDNLIFPYVKGDAYFTINKYKKAEIEYLDALKLSPESRLIRNSLITLYESQNNISLSDSLFKILIFEDKNDALTLNNYAYSLCERDIINASIMEYALSLSEKALEIEPKNAAFLDTKGWIYYRMKNYNKAEEYIKNSIEIDNTNSVVLKHLADLYIEKNKISDAIKYYKAALENDPNNIEAIQKIQKYEKN